MTRTIKTVAVPCLRREDVTHHPRDPAALALSETELAVRMCPPETQRQAVQRRAHELELSRREHLERSDPGAITDAIQAQIRAGNAELLAEAMRLAAVAPIAVARPPAPRQRRTRLEETERDAAVRRAEEAAAGLALSRLRRGLPLTEAAWSIEVMAFYIRDRWPEEKGRKIPPPSTIAKYLTGAIKRELLPHASAWPVDGEAGDRPD